MVRNWRILSKPEEMMMLMSWALELERRSVKTTYLSWDGEIIKIQGFYFLKVARRGLCWIM
jgi:hypothetical protein